MPKYDVVAFQAGPSGQGLLDQALIEEGNPGEVVQGPIKLAQQWLLTFLCPQGTVKGFPDRGTTFLSVIQSGQIRNEQDLTAIYRAAERDTNRQIWAAEIDDMPDDERLAESNLQGISYLGDSATITVQIVTGVGDTRTIMLPVPVMV